VPEAPALLSPLSLTVTVTVAAFAATARDRRTELDRIRQVVLFMAATGFGLQQLVLLDGRVYSQTLNESKQNSSKSSESQNRSVSL
jgi:hypothetical protein